MRQIFVLAFSLLVTGAWSQVVNPDLPTREDTVEQQRPKRPDSLKEKIQLRAIRFGTDVLALALSSSPRFRGWEVNTDIDLGRFYLAGDYGSSTSKEVISNGGDYSSEGNYWRAGVDINILKKDPDRNMLFFGLRYARSSFSDQINQTVIDPYFGTQQYALSNPEASAVWVEMVAGLRVKIWKELWMGFTSRLKMGLSVRGNEQLSSYFVPGYGNIANSWGFNYQVFWRIPFAKQKKPAAAKP